MRIPAVMLAAALVAAPAVTGCGAPRSACRGPVTGEVSFSSSSTPPPYHYVWTLTLAPGADELVLSPGYNSPERWATTFTVPEDQLRAACLELRKLDDDNPAPGSGVLQVALSSPGPGSLRLTTTRSEAVDTVRGIIPAAAWTEVSSAYEQWQADYPGR